MAKRNEPSGAFACARKPVVRCGAQDQAGADPGLLAVVTARLKAVPDGQLGEISTEAAHITLIWPVSAVADAEPMSRITRRFGRLGHEHR